MNKHTEDHLRDFAKKVRLNILKMSKDGGCFTGASLSAVEIVTYLYNCFLEISPETFDSDSRDYFFLSKGHAVPVLYGAFVELGWLDEERLNNHLKIIDNIYWHPNRDIPGIEFHSGSLGHLLSVAAGVALDIKLRKQTNKVVVITGDGEFNEGSNWESLLTVSAFKLDNLIIIIDRNKFQANIETENLIPLEPLKDKISAFGCYPVCVDGNDFASLDSAFNLYGNTEEKPLVIIADTVRGKGIGSIEARADKWYCNFHNGEITIFSNELNGL